MTELEFLEYALKDYEYALEQGYQKEINFIWKDLDEYRHVVGEDFPDHLVRFCAGLCYYKTKVFGEICNADLSVYFEVAELNHLIIYKFGNLQIRIDWMKRAIELIKHREQVEIHKNLGNPKFAYTDDTYNREQVKKAIWKEQ